MTPPAPSILPTPVRRRANLIGRTALYSVTVFLCTLAVLLPASWVVAFVRLPAAARVAFQSLVAANAVSGIVAFIALFILQRFLVPQEECITVDTTRARFHVALIALNDEACIGEAVRDFKGANADRLVVVDNNSSDRTAELAREAGAEVVIETTPGYGACCMRALAEAERGLSSDDIIVLCEGDLTFVSNDLPKFAAYIQNADLVLGTRATQELRDTDTQMDWLINPANQIVAKLVQTRFWGTRLTDVGCTYRAIRVSAYRRLRGRLRVPGNHFSPHMFIEALRLGMRVVEIPIVFRKRGGLSKGVGSNKLKAAGVALRMLGLIYRS